MKQNEIKRHVVLAAVDRSEARDAVIQAAQSLTRSGSEIHLVHVIPQMSRVVLLEDGANNERDRLEIADARNFLDETVSGARLRDASRLYAHLTAGEPARGILQLASDIQADVIAIGTHDYRGVRRMVLGSVSEQVTKRAQCPVLVVRPLSYAGTQPEIEAPCPNCLATQLSSMSESLWCEAHNHRRRHAHVYHARQATTFGDGSMFVK